VIVCKRIIPFFLLAVLLFGGLRYAIFSSYLRYQKNEFRTNTLLYHQNRLFVLEINKEKLYIDLPGQEWKKNNKELVISGIYHEVLKVEIFENSANVFIIPDEAETRFFENWFKDDKESPTNIAGLLHYIVYSPEQPLKVFNPQHQNTRSYFSSKTHYSFLYMKRLFKPPCV